MAIVLISESLLERSTARDGRVLRDRVLSGFCVRMNARKRAFRVATSVAGKQFRMTLGHWPLMSVEEARALATTVLVPCRRSRSLWARCNHQSRSSLRSGSSPSPATARVATACCSSQSAKAFTSGRTALRGAISSQ